MQRLIALITLGSLPVDIGVQAEENRTETLDSTPTTEPGYSADTRARLENDLEIPRALTEIAPAR